jgi:cyclophilin family peptidyl-prolyl cis-trans isomerase
VGLATIPSLAHAGAGDAPAAVGGETNPVETIAARPNATMAEIHPTARTVPRVQLRVLPSAAATGGSMGVTRVRALVLAVFMLGLSSGCAPKEEPLEETANGEEAVDEIAVIQVREFGEIRIRFLTDKAPGHVENFKKLARAGFYDGTTFHRIVPGFVIQGGDPNSKDDNPGNDGTGGPGYSIQAEFSDVPHTRGILSMARSSDPDSAGSQFFIVVKEANLLDGQYTVFGEVITGMEVVDSIVAQPRDRRDRPIANIVMEKVRIEPAG